MENRSLVTIAEHSKEKILYMLNMAKEFEAKPNRHLLDGKVVATLFFEPSTRTRLSFETAANRLGARVIGFSDPESYQLVQRRDTERYHQDGKQLCRHHRNAPLPGRSRTLCQRSNHSAHRQCRRRSQPASLANDARPLLHLQDARYAGEPEHLPGRRFEIRPYRTLPADGHAALQPHLSFHRSRRTENAEGTRFTAANMTSDSWSTPTLRKR